MKEITIGKKSVKLPEEWAELSRDQYFTFLLLYSAVLSGRMSALKAEHTFFSFLIGWNGADWEKISRQEVGQQLSREFQESRQRFRMDRLPYTGGKNLMPEWEGHRGPSDMFGSVRWGTYSKCLSLLSVYIGNKDQEALKIMASQLYRLPKGKEPDSVLQLHSLILMHSMMTMIETEPINIDGKDIDFSIIFKGNGGEDDNTGITGVTFAVAESGVFGDYKKVNAAGMWEIMLYLYKCKKKESKHKKS